MKVFRFLAPLFLAAGAFAQSPLVGPTWAFQLHTGAFAPSPSETYYYNGCDPKEGLSPSPAEGGLLGSGYDCDAPAPSPIEGGMLAAGGNSRASALIGNATVQGAAAIGTFTAGPNGALAGNITYSVDGAIARRVALSGRYLLNGDGTGGELLFYVNGFSAQLEFVWASNFTRMLFVDDGSGIIRGAGNTIALTGVALKAPASGCPSNLGSPLNILANTSWSYRLSQTYYYAPGNAAVGIFRPFVLNGAGFLTGSDTTHQVPAPIYRWQQTSGRYQVYDDCSGGEIMLMNRQPAAVQLEFVFVGENREEMFMLNDNASGDTNVALGGNAFRR